MAKSPIIIAHRGASADRPEHTLSAYALAIEQGADFIEPDLVSTKDGHLVARHENEIGSTTDVADRPEFAARKTEKVIEGHSISGWFTEDFLLSELKLLRARERLPQLRPANTRYDGQDSIPTLQEIIALVKSEEGRRGRRIGLYPETKHPSYFRAIGLPLEPALIKQLGDAGYQSEEDPIFIQSFEVGNLKLLRSMTKLRLIQLMASEGGPADLSRALYAEMATSKGLKTIAAYADGIGVEKAMVIPRNDDNQLAAPTSLVADAHAAGLEVHVWTFRPEGYFLPAEYRRGFSPLKRGDAVGEIRKFLGTGIDGFFSDSVAEAVEANGR